MKLIIDIPNNTREQIFDICNSGSDIPLGTNAQMIKAIVNGIPLSEMQGRIVEVQT